MLKRYHALVGGTFRILDALIIGAIWILSYWLRFYLPVIAVTKGFPSFHTYASLTPLVMILWGVIFQVFRVYRPRRILRRTDEVFLLLKAHLMALLVFIALTSVFSEYRYSRGVILYFAFLGAALLAVFRLTLRNLLRSLRRKGHNLRYALLVGEGPIAEAMVFKLSKYPELGVKVVGAVIHEDSKAQKVGSLPVLGHFKGIESILKKQTIDQILIALPRAQSMALDSILDVIRDEAVEIRLVPDVLEYVTLGCEIEEFDGYPVVNLNDSPMDGWGMLMKRLTDIFFSALGLLILSPILAVVACAVKFSSKGSVLYKQTRMGLDGRSFEMLKFRSMRADAEKDSGAVWAVEKDPRRTRIGTFLRATSLDEFPQLWNVLVGHMSLVGPRPERPVFVDKFKKEIPHYMLRHKVKAGITGWAQVNGWRGNTSLESRIEYDLYYIRNWSYLLDMKILFMTVWKGFINKNAY
jgi:Undecaprenyl-phosphate glucose phosphotransferase